MDGKIKHAKATKGAGVPRKASPTQVRNEGKTQGGNIRQSDWRGWAGTKESQRRGHQPAPTGLTFGGRGRKAEGGHRRKTGGAGGDERYVGGGANKLRRPHARRNVEPDGSGTPPPSSTF